MKPRPPKQRARTAEEKGARRAQVIAAARGLFRRRGFHEISVADVARAARVAKGTVFLYFESKEELFFALACDELARWLDDMDELFRGLAASRPRPDAEAVFAALGAVLRRHSLSRRLIAILHSVLEHNVRYAEVLRFKRMMGARLPATGALIEQVLPFLEPGQGAKLLLWMYALVIGFAHLAEPPASVERVYREDRDLRWMQLDFGTAYFEALGAIIDGWRLRAGGRSAARKGDRR